MKKTGLLITILVGLIGLFLFQGTSFAGNTISSGKIRIVTSLPIVKNIVEKIGGDKVTVESIIQGTACNHEYEPTAGDMKKIATCAVFVKIGMGSDTWADKLATGTLSKKALFIDPSKGIKTVKVHNLDNPHYWGSPDNIKLMAKNILDGLTSIDPAQKLILPVIIKISSKPSIKRLLN